MIIFPAILALLAWIIAMALPDTLIERRDLAHSSTAPTDIGVGFVVLLTDRGPIIPTLVTSLQDLVNNFGPKQTWSQHYDGADVFFREKGYALYVSRAVGPGATFSAVNLVDNAAATSLIVTDKVGPGASNVTVDLITNASDAVLVPVAGHFRIRTRWNGNLVEDSGDLLTRAAAVAWSASSRFVGITLGGSTNVPVAVSAAALTGGSDDHASVAQAHYQTAIDKFDPDLGPGQISIPGATSDALHGVIVAHGLANNRSWVLDLPDTANDATLRTSMGFIRALGRVGGSDKGGGFAPWDDAPGEVAGTRRVVPPSWRQMATMGRNDAAGMSPNEPAAGDNGQALYVDRLSQPAWSKATRQALNEAGVNVSIIKNNTVTTFGFRTAVDQTTEANYSLLSNQRLEMAIRADFKVIEDAFQFKELDGFGRNTGRFASRLTSVLMKWFDAGSLKGETPGQAFSVDTGPSVNTNDTMAALELRAETVVRMAPFNERTIIGIAKVPSNQEV